VSIGTKKQAKQWKGAYLPNKLKKIKQILSARKLMVTVFLDRIKKC
jgi:hypothetical protein